VNGMKKVYFKTFGCRTNQYDTGIMVSRLRRYEATTEENEADIVVVNSCTVTNGADSSVRNYISSLRRRRPDVRIVLAGCGSHSRGEDLLSRKRVDGVMGHSEKERIDEILSLEDGFYEIGDLKHIDDTVVESFSGRSRAFIKIQEGCDFRCSYCIIPHVRGDARSQREERILLQISKLASNGFGEFILTGTNVGSYGRDRGESLATLLKKISSIRGVRRIRIGSLEPIQIDDELMEILDEEWMARHLHIALQHTSDAMLEAMNRRNRYEEDRRLFQRIADRGYAIGTDFIVGHPGEGEGEWREAIERVKELPLTHIHAFTYSRRDGTVSAGMGDIVRGDVARARHREIREIVAEKNRLFRLSHDRDLRVLFENGKDGVYRGYDQYYNRVSIESPHEDLSNTWMDLERVEVGIDENFAIYKA